MRNHNQAKNNNSMTDTTESSLTQTQAHHNYGSSVDFTGESVSLTDSEIESLLLMIEEEKMTHDLYAELYEQTGLVEFESIMESEQIHYDKLVSIAEKFDVDTSSLSTEAGVYTNDEIQNLYDSALAEASLSTEAAIAVSISLEEADIANLESAIGNPDIVLLGQVYSHLLDASMNHLGTFEGIA